MPTYDYECQECGHAFEKFQSMTARVLRKCPSCGKRKLERLIGPGAGFIFKGDGFYVTDYRSDSYKAGESAAGGSGKTPKPGADKGSADKGSADKGGADKGSADKGSADKGSAGSGDKSGAADSPKTKAS